MREGRCFMRCVWAGMFGFVGTACVCVFMRLGCLQSRVRGRVEVPALSLVDYCEAFSCLRA